MSLKDEKLISLNSLTTYTDEMKKLLKAQGFWIGTVSEWESQKGTIEERLILILDDAIQYSSIQSTIPGEEDLDDIFDDEDTSDTSDSTLDDIFGGGA